MKKYVFLILAAIIASSSAMASEDRILGKVLDAKAQSPIEYANVLILDKDSTFLKGCVSGKDGSFGIPYIPTNSAILKISFVGYHSAVYAISELNLKKENVFELIPSAVTLKEVTVRANGKPFTVEDEKIVFNPSFVAHAINANDIIKLAPGVMDTGASVIMPGKDDVKIYINNKEQKGSTDDILLLLKSYPAEDVTAVEVMTNPPSKYTMGRNVGVINIKLKKKAANFLGGNLGYSFDYDTKAGNEVTAGFIYNGKRLSTTLNATGHINKYDLLEKNTVGFADYSRFARTDMTRKADDLIVRWNMNYQITDNWDAGLTAYYSKGKMKQNADHRYEYSYYDGRKEEELIDGHRTDEADTYSASLDLNGKLSERSDLTVNVDFYHKDSPTERVLDMAIDKSPIEYSQNNIKSTNVTAKVNYSIVPNDKLSLNFGADGFFTKSKNSEYGIYEGVSDNDRFEYNENELDLYGEARYKFNKEWMLRGSLRYQSIWTEAKAAASDKNTVHTDVVCPAVFLSYMFRENQSLQLGFYSNINMPMLTALNPAELYIGNDTYRRGNPDLEYSKHYLLSLSYSFGSLMVQPYVEWLNDGITEISMLDGRNQIMTWENAVDRRTIGLMLFYSYSKLKWMRASAIAFLNNDVTTSSHPLLLKRESSFKFSASPNLQFYFDNDRKWILSLSGQYSTPIRTVDMKLKSSWTLNAGLTWKPNKKWAFSATGQNLLHSHTRGTQYIGGSSMKFDNKYMYTGFKLSASYTFGKSMGWFMDRSVIRNMNSRTELD